MYLTAALLVGLVFTGETALHNNCFGATLRAGIFVGPLAGDDGGLAREMEAAVVTAGYGVERIDSPTLTDPSAFSGRKLDLLVLAGARSLPAAAAGAIEQYLREGGDLLVVGLPAWEEASFDIGGRWMSRVGFEAMLATRKPEAILVDFTSADLRAWSRATDDLQIPVRHEISRAGSGNALHVWIQKVTGWETFLSPIFTNAFPPGHTLTCFRAKGGPNTRQLALEWTERDGSRWIGAVELTTEWRNYVLPPEAFKAWQPPASRAGKEDHFRPRDAARFVVGLAHSHNTLGSGAHEYWFADLGTATNPFGGQAIPAGIPAPHLESISPGHQFFPITGKAVVVSAREPTLRRLPADRAAEPPGGLLGLHPRPQGAGFHQERQYRWEPLLVARDGDNGDYRGAIAALLIHGQPPFRGGVWAVFTPNKAEFYHQPLVRRCLNRTLARMREGIFLMEGGADFFTIFANQRFNVGAEVVNFGKETATNLTLSLDLGSEGKSRTVRKSTFSLAPGEQRPVVVLTNLGGIGSEEVAATLSRDSKRIDGLAHPIHVWQPSRKRDFIEARAGQFLLRGKRWKAHGVNYMPSSGIGLENQQHFEYWLGRGAYDPEVIERDLGRIKAMNLNAVSVFVYHESLTAQHLLDFLRRCEVLGLHVNLSLRPGTPLDFHWKEMKELIEYFHLAENDTVFAYDLAWEPRHGSHAEQEQAYRASWVDWVAKRYRSAGDMAQAWGEEVTQQLRQTAPEARFPSIPPMKWLTQDGRWRRCIADYRSFLDEVLRDGYGTARRLVRSVDERHLVSFRMQHAGDSTFNWDAFLPYDFNGLVGAVDIWEPEAYGRIGDWEQVKAGRFTADYGRLCDRSKPLFWAEMGYSVWDDARKEPSVEKLEFQARYFSDFYRMLNDSDADGIFFWWYPGGYRLNEQSDFGIINPDGTDRRVTQIIREEGGKFLKTSGAGIRPNHWISVDRDRDSRGLFGMYEAVRREYWAAIAAGQKPGLQWSKVPGAPASEGVSER